MNIDTTVTALSALANEHRLQLFRLLMARGPSGMAAGAIAEAVGISPSSLTFHAGTLERAGLLRSWRVHRNVFYAVDIEGMRRVLAFLTEECCDGRPELCGDLAGPRERDGGTRAAMSDRVYNVLFLCTGNSARSILGEAILNRIGEGRFRAYSAGSHPQAAVHPYALDLLRNQDYPVDGLRSKSWDEFAAPDAPVMDFVFTVCDDAAAEVCPAWPGQPISAHWGLPDPAAAGGSEAERRYAFADTFRMLHNRISIFVNLPIRSLDRLALQERVDSIGAQTAETV